MADKSSVKHHKRRLGRGLSSLITSSMSEATLEGRYESSVESPKVHEAIKLNAATGESTRKVAISDIAPNPYQPRRNFSEAGLAELTDSIRQQGILQPILIAPAGPDASKPFVLVAGERRLRAAQKAELDSVPAIVREATAQQMAEWALVENLQRSDLNPIERAEAYHKYMEQFKLTHAQAAERLGEPRATVSNYLRLLDLCDEVQSLLRSGELTFGHAKILAGLINQPDRQAKLARKIVSKGLSVRNLEQLMAGADQPHETAAKVSLAKPAYLRDLEEQLTSSVGTRVQVKPGRKKNTGKIVIDYYSLDDFDRISNALGAKIDS